MSTIYDPLAAAVMDAENAGTFYGKLEVDGQPVILKKGQRKTAWVEGMDTDGRTTEVTFRLNPIDATGMTRMVEKSVISNSGEWSKIAWPSLRELGIKSLPELRGKFAKIALVESGRTWTNDAGELIHNTTMKFLALYDTEAQAIAAYQGGDVKEAHTPQTNAVAAPEQPATEGGMARTDAARFLPMIGVMGGGDPVKLAAALKQFPDVAAHFQVDSPEILALLKAA